VWLLATMPRRERDANTENHGMVHGTTRNNGEIPGRDGKECAGGSEDAERSTYWPLPRWPFLWQAIRPWLPAIALGVICAVQQTAWFFAPFYLVWVWRTYGVKRAISEEGVAVGAFFLINLPWSISAPGPWLHSLVLPVTLPLFPTGGGLVGLGLGGTLPLWPPLVYAMLEIGGYLGLLALYARWFARLPFAGLLLPMVALLLAWRSPSRYFILLPFLAILALVLSWKPRTPQAP
jgi:uncharacterized membrane protein